MRVAVEGGGRRVRASARMCVYVSVRVVGVGGLYVCVCVIRRGDLLRECECVCARARVRICVCVCVSARTRARVCVCVQACVRAPVRACVQACV